VISVGNLSVGGSGKTPVVAALARMLLAWGERPAILSRGYARRRGGDGVVVVSDGRSLLEPVERSGDEPQMLARALPDVPVLVCPDRYLAGRLAERQLNCTVLVLDDGFQHLPLGRQVDVLVMPASDLDEAVLPSGRLREELDAACSAHCILVPGSDDDVARVSASFERTPVFRVVRRYEPLRSLESSSQVAGSRVAAVAAIGRPQQFFNALREQGYDVVREVPFPDHHWFTASDVERIHAAARGSGADLVVTTEKDAVRLPPQPPPSPGFGAAAWAVLPMTAAIEPPDRFSSWLRERL
jgi:tetraacyldisaccharide 4'-kinase